MVVVATVCPCNNMTTVMLARLWLMMVVMMLLLLQMVTVVAASSVMVSTAAVLDAARLINGVVQAHRTNGLGASLCANTSGLKVVQLSGAILDRKTMLLLLLMLLLQGGSANALRR